MPTAITVKNLQKRIPLKRLSILRPAKTILHHEGIKSAESRCFDSELSIVFVTDARIKSLNKKYLNQNNSTDVLAFNNLSFPNARLPARQALVRNPNKVINRPPTKNLPAGRQAFGGDNISGEIIISTDTAVKHAKIYHTTPQREILLYVVHGILHLLGYDDHRNCDLRKMRRKEQILMNVISK